MKKIFTFMTVLLTLLLAVNTAFAADGNVTYRANAREFFFAPGSSYSPTDLFANFKDVIPGDTRSQKITVRCDASKNVKAKLYLRSEYKDQASKDFLSQMKFTLTKSNDNGMAYMFNESGSFTPDNDGWIFLGTIYSGGEVDLLVNLEVPTTVDNSFGGQVGHVIWEFRADEEATSPDDPKPPKTGDNGFMPVLFTAITGGALFVVLILTVRRKRSS